MIQKARPEDLPRLLPLYANARAFMARTGNPNQWGKTVPAPEVLAADIERGDLYIEQEADEILGAFVFFTRPEPTYRTIDGAWAAQTPYGTLHRVASSGARPGFMDRVCAFAKTRADHLRIDTHADNKVMQKAILRNGFTYRGIITLQNGDPRLAYDWQK